MHLHAVAGNIGINKLAQKRRLALAVHIVKLQQIGKARLIPRKIAGRGVCVDAIDPESAQIHAILRLFAASFLPALLRYPAH